MSQWTETYISNIEYVTDFCYDESPNTLQFVHDMHKRSAPTHGEVNFCELGCGPGLSINILAAANPHINFYANDFLRDHIDQAQRLSAEFGTANTHFYRQSFADFIDQPDLPLFDFIIIRGIYSWVSDENRRLVRQFVARRSKPECVVLLTYDAMPGWATGAALQKLMVSLPAIEREPAQSYLDRSLDLIARLRKAGSGFFQVNPSAGLRADYIAQQNVNYVAHEYLNREFKAFFSSEIHETMGSIGFSYAGSANLGRNAKSSFLDAGQLEVIRSARSLSDAEFLQDFITNDGYRSDVFSQTPALSEDEIVANLGRWSFAPLRRAASTDLPAIFERKKVEGALRGRHGDRLYRAIMEALAEGPKSATDILAAIKDMDATPAELREHLMLLAAVAFLEPFIDAGQRDERERSAARFNAAILERASTPDYLAWLVSPVTNSAINVSLLDQIMLLARDLPDYERREITTAQIMALGGMPGEDGGLLTHRDEIAAELDDRFATFTAERLPVLEALGLVPPEAAQ
jgi:hypothetical protein